MTNTIAPNLSLFVVIRPLGSADLSDAYAASVPAATDPVKVAHDLASNVALFDSGTLVAWRTVEATDAGAARLKWPARARRSQGGRFMV
jgi:hypothetical protein